VRLDADAVADRSAEQFVYWARPGPFPSTPEEIQRQLARGFTAFRTFPAKKRPSWYIETPAAVEYAAEQFAELRKLVGNEADLAIDLAQNHDVMAEIARGTFLPIATGERVFTKWGFREVLEKRAATVLQPDLCHAGGITEVRLIAGMAEAYYASVAPHNPVGPISLAAGVQIAASIPNFLCQEQVSLGEGYIKKPFTVRDGYLDLPSGPGLGIELDEDALADKIGHDWRNPERYDVEDGSVVDW
jgi:galactonate dehydratase